MPSSASPRTSLRPLSLHDALPIFIRWRGRGLAPWGAGGVCTGPPRGRRSARGDARSLDSLDPSPQLGRRLQDCVLLCEVDRGPQARSEEHTSELQSRGHLVCRLLHPLVPAYALFPCTTLFRSSSGGAAAAWLRGARGECARGLHGVDGLLAVMPAV